MILPVPQKWRDDPARAALVDLADDFYVEPAWVAKRWCIAESRLAQLRFRKLGPAFVKLTHGGHPRYRASEILRYERDGLVQTTDVVIRKGKPRGRRT